MSDELTLGAKQRLFTALLAKLVSWSYGQGYELTYGRTWMSEEENRRIGGHAKSLHCKRLAADLNLFIDGEYQTSTEAHRRLGDYWKSLHHLCRWGGDFVDKNGKPKPDGNHYSVEHEGMK